MYLTGSQIDKLVIDNGLSNAQHIKDLKEFVELLENSKILNDIYINIKNLFSSINKIIKNGR